MENIIAHDQFVRDSDQLNQLKLSVEETTKSTVRPNAELSDGLNLDQTSRTRMGLIVSSTGERTMYHVDVHGARINAANQFDGDNRVSPDIEPTPDEIARDIALKIQTSHLQKRRSIIEKERRRTPKRVSTHRNSSRQKLDVKKSASASTDLSINGVNIPVEYIGDPGKFTLSFPKKVNERSASRKDLASNECFVTRCITKSMMVLLASFMALVVIVFLLDVEIMSEFFRMASYYLRCFDWGYSRKPQQTYAEKYLEWLHKIFE